MHISSLGEVQILATPFDRNFLNMTACSDPTFTIDQQGPGSYTSEHYSFDVLPPARQPHFMFGAVSTEE